MLVQLPARLIYYPHNPLTFERNQVVYNVIVARQLNSGQPTMVNGNHMNIA